MNAHQHDVEQHPYFVKKCLEHSYDLRFTHYLIKGLEHPAIVVPIYNFKYSIQAVQLIFCEKVDFGDGKPRDKHTVGPIGGHFYLLGQPSDYRLYALCEGVATGFSIFLSKLCTTLCCLSCTNYRKVVEGLMMRFPYSEVMIACDNDVGTVGNPGVTHAKKIQERYPQIKLLIPPARDNSSTDISDLFTVGGENE